MWFHFYKVLPYCNMPKRYMHSRSVIIPPAYPRHLCRGVYSFRLSVRMFVRSFVPTSFRHVEFASKFCVKVSQVVYISATTHQKAFIFGP